LTAAPAPIIVPARSRQRGCPDIKAADLHVEGAMPGETAAGGSDGVRAPDRALDDALLCAAMARSHMRD